MPKFIFRIDMLFVKNPKEWIPALVAFTGNKDLKKAASKYWRYARTMQTRGVKRTRGTTQPEKDYIKNYAKTWVVKSFRDKATQPEKDEIDAKINAKKTRETATKFPEEDQIIELGLHSGKSA